MSVNQHERLAAESTEQREVRLLQVSVNQHERLATESTEQREARLLQVRANQRQRRAAESLEERENRLLQLRVNQRERLAAESLEESESMDCNVTGKGRLKLPLNNSNMLLRMRWAKQTPPLAFCTLAQARPTHVLHVTSLKNNQALKCKTLGFVIKLKKSHT